MATKQIWCREHPSYSVTQKPSIECFECQNAFERHKFKIRLGEVHKGKKRGDALGGRGSCGVCLVKNTRLTLSKMASGKEICEICLARFEKIDSGSISRDGIQYDMKVMGIPVSKMMKYHAIY